MVTFADMLELIPSVVVLAEKDEDEELDCVAVLVAGPGLARNKECSRLASTHIGLKRFLVLKSREAYTMPALSRTLPGLW